MPAHKVAVVDHNILTYCGTVVAGFVNDISVAGYSEV